MEFDFPNLLLFPGPACDPTKFQGAARPILPGTGHQALGQPGAGLLALQSSLLRPTPQGAVSTGKLHSYGAGLQRVNDRVSNVSSPDPDPTTMKSLDAGNTLEAMPHSRRWRSEVSRGRATQTCLASS